DSRIPFSRIRHFGELSLGTSFDGLLPWGWVDNRPFLRCMHGFGLCLWRLGRFEEAGHIFNRMLWLNPSDNQGVRFLIDDIHAKISWETAEARQGQAREERVFWLLSDTERSTWILTCSWFGTRGLKVQILSPRPIFSSS